MLVFMDMFSNYYAVMVSKFQKVLEDLLERQHRYNIFYYCFVHFFTFMVGTLL